MPRKPRHPEQMGDKFHFKIEKFTPATLPMARLAEYMADLALLLGHQDKVHFVKVAEGSADLVHVVEPDEQEQVIQRIHLVKIGDGPQDAQKAYRSLNQKLRDDGTSAKMTRGRGKLLYFEGVKAPKPASYGPINQPGILQGKVIKLGGKDETKPVHIMDMDGRYYICNANPDVAKRISKSYEEYVRVQGTGKWVRNDDGQWSLEYFNITDFEPLENESLAKVIGALREIPDNGWRNIPDPLAELASIRHGGKLN